MADLKSDIKEAFAADPLGHLKRWFPEGKREAGRFRTGSIYGEKGRSLSISLNGENPGMGTDHATGNNIKDVIDLYAHAFNYQQRGPEFRKMLNDMASEMGIEIDKPNGATKANLKFITTCEWMYQAHDGSDWALVRRRDAEDSSSKKYSQHSPSGMPGLPEYDGKLPLYRMHDLSDASTVLVVSGEKCVDVTKDLKIDATTSIGGESKAHYSDWSLLDDKHVIIWPDNDKAGRKYASEVAALCEGAASIHIIEPRPNAPSKWDIADAVAEGLDVEPFLNDAKPFQEEWPAHATMAAFANLEPPTREFIVDQWLPRGHVTSIYGKGGSGKSLLAQQIASCVASGEMFFDCPVNSGPVLAVFAEDCQDELHRRHRDICKRLVITSEKLKDFHYICMGMRPHEAPDFCMIDFPMIGRPNVDWSLTQDIESLCKKIKPRLLIIDNIAQVFGGNENDRSQVTFWLNRMNSLAQEYDMAVVLIGHFRKGGDTFSGSTAWEAGVRSLCQFEPMGDEQGAPIRFERVKSNYAGRGAMVLKWDQGSFKLAGQLTAEELQIRDDHDTEARKAVLLAISFLNEREVTSSAKPQARNRLIKLMRTFPGPDGELLAGQFSDHALQSTLNQLISDQIVLVDQSIKMSGSRNVIKSLMVNLEGQC